MGRVSGHVAPRTAREPASTSTPPRRRRGQVSGSARSRRAPTRPGLLAGAPAAAVGRTGPFAEPCASHGQVPRVPARSGSSSRSCRPGPRVRVSRRWAVFDAAHAALGIGKIAIAAGIRQSIEKARACYDFTRGPEPYKYWYSATDRQAPSIVVGSSRPLAGRPRLRAGRERAPSARVRSARCGR